MDGVRALGGARDSGKPNPESVPDEEIARADVYRLLGRLLAAPPDARTLEALSKLPDEASELGSALGDLARAAASATPEVSAREYHDLFIGIGRGELLPYASYYLTGFLHERPLAKLRAELAILGIERAPNVSEPEDHAAALCEVMAGLINGAFGATVPIDRQRQFFDAFIAPWLGRFFADLERAQAAKLYAAVGCIGSRFFAIEQTAFSVA